MAFQTPSSAGITTGTTTLTGGTDTRVLFNDGGLIGEDAGLTYVKGTNTLTVGTQISVGETGVADGSIVLKGGVSGFVKVKASENAITSYTIALPTAVGGAGTFMYDVVGDGELANTVNLTWNDTTNALKVNTIPLSTVATTTFAIGDTTDNCLDFVVGNGVSNAVPVVAGIHGTAGSGTNVGGATLEISGGQGTGNTNGGGISLMYSPAGVSGAAINALTDGVEVTGDKGALKLHSGAILNRTTYGAGSATVGQTDNLIAKTAMTGGGDTLTLPNNQADGWIYIVKDESGTIATDNLTIDVAGGGTIDGASSVVMSTNYQSLTFYNVAGNFFII